MKRRPTIYRERKRWVRIVEPLTDEPEATPEEIEYARSVRPSQRSQCIHGPRPCPWVGCRYHLALQRAGTTALAKFFCLDPTTMGETCALDVAARGAHTLDSIALIMHITRERVRQIQDRAQQRIERMVRQYR